MRVIAGELRGRKFEVPRGSDVRPTLDKVKGAVFNMLNNMVEWEDCKVIDVFCGCGNLGIEAASRGAASICFIDKDRESIRYTKQNIENLKIENTEVICADALKLRSTGEKFNLIFMDPPYSLKLGKKVLERLREQDMLEDEFIAILEVDAKTKQSIPEFCELLSERVYGNCKLLVLRSLASKSD